LLLFPQMFGGKGKNDTKKKEGEKGMLPYHFSTKKGGQWSISVRIWPSGIIILRKKKKEKRTAAAAGEIKEGKRNGGGPRQPFLIK